MIFLFKRNKYKSKNPLSKILLKKCYIFNKIVFFIHFSDIFFNSSEWKFTEYTNFRF